MKLLSGREIQGYIKARQAHDVKSLRSRKIFPKLVIFYDNDDPVIDKYMTLKQRYGNDIGVETEIIKFQDQAQAEKVLLEKAQDPEIHGIIIQLPLKNIDQEILKSIPPEKDVDGLNDGMDSATADAINWLLGSYNIELAGKKLAIVGRGKLVGAPLYKMWSNSGFNVELFHRGDDLNKLINYDVIVTATGSPAIIKPEMLKSGAVVVDAGTASEGGVIVGDLAPEVYQRKDLTLTPQIGGVGPLTISLLFEHLLIAAKKQA